MNMKKEKGIEIKLVASFECAIWQNAVNICTSLAQAGRLVQIRMLGTTFTVEVYERLN